MVQQKIQNLIEERIRPALQSHGGDIEFISFDEVSGGVTVTLKGACGMCPYAQETLRSQVEGVLCQEIPEVKSVTRQE